MENLLTLNELQPLILEWAKNKKLLKKENASSQVLKLVEEVGELCSGVLKKNIPLQKDALGDIFVVMIILHNQIDRFTDLDFRKRNIDPEAYFYEYVFDLLGRYSGVLDNNNFYSDDELGFEVLNNIAVALELDLTECANIAWNEIKNRTGKTVNGTFIKD